MSFKSVHYTKLRKLLSIKPQRYINYSHQSIGLAESLHSKIEIMTKQAIKDWDQWRCDQFTRAICFNNERHIRDGMKWSSNCLLMEYQPRDISDIRCDPNCETAEYKLRLSELQECCDLAAYIYLINTQSKRNMTGDIARSHITRVKLY